MRLIVVLIACLFVVPAASGQTKKARKLLSQLTSVDGQGSGLDADTIRGMTPQQLLAQQQPPSDAATLNGMTAQQIITAAIPTVIAYINANSYVRAGTVSIDPGFCDCAYAACDDANDYRINCTGGFSPAPGVQGTMSSIGSDATTANGCGTCGCNVSGTQATLVTGVICVAVP